MRMFLVVAAAAGAFTATAAAAPIRLSHDPRTGCGSVAEACANSTARRVLNQRIKTTLHRTATSTCQTRGASILRFTCFAGDTYGHQWRGAVTFTKAHGAWWAAVTVRPL